YRKNQLGNAADFVGLILKFNRLLKADPSRYSVVKALRAGLSPASEIFTDRRALARIRARNYLPYFERELRKAGNPPEVMAHLRKIKIFPADPQFKPALSEFFRLLAPAALKLADDMDRLMKPKNGFYTS